MINHSKYQDMLVCQKTPNLFIIFACGLVLLMPDCLFFLTTHVPEIFLVFVWVCGLSVKKSKQGFIYLICIGNINFAKKGVHIYMQVGELLFVLSIWHFEIVWYNKFISYISAHFTEPLLSGNVLEIPCPSQVGYLNISTIKGRTSKVTAEDGSGPLVVSDIPGIKSFFLTF